MGWKRISLNTDATTTLVNNKMDVLCTLESCRPGKTGAPEHCRHHHKDVLFGDDIGEMAETKRTRSAQNI